MDNGRINKELKELQDGVKNVSWSDCTDHSKEIYHHHHELPDPASAIKLMLWVDQNKFVMGGEMLFAEWYLQKINQ